MNKLSIAALVVLAACSSDKSAGQGPYAKEVASAIPQVEKAVGLRFKTPPKVEIRSRDELTAFLIKNLDEEQPALELAGEEKAYKLFGLLPDSINLRKFLLELLTEQVIGYYDPSTKVLYIVSGGGSARGGGAAPSPEALNITIQHELVHALQDQYLALDSLSKEHGDNDRRTAAQAIVEGQATYEQMSIMLGGGNFALRMPGGWDRIREMVRQSRGTMPIFGSAPLLIQETLLFPYLSGAEFVRQFKERKPGQSLYGSIPVSTEQVLHPERMLSGDSTVIPLRVTLPALSGGSKVYENNLGEFETRLVLFEQLQDAETARRGAEGWAGDRYEVVNTGSGAALVWLTVWDSPVEAAEFRDLMSRTIEKRFELKENSGGSGSTLRYRAKSRSIELRAVTVQGRAGVLYVDSPGSTDLIDVSKVKVERR